MTWHLGWCPWNDPVSDAQERTEAMLRREDEECLRSRDSTADTTTSADKDRVTGVNLPAGPQAVRK